MASYPSIRHGEECMRDGMQIESRTIPVADKIRLIDALSETGLKEIAVGSFASPKWAPQMAQVEDVIRGFHPSRAYATPRQPSTTAAGSALARLLHRSVKATRVRPRRSTYATCSRSGITTARSSSS